MRDLIEMPTTHPFIEVTHYTLHKGVAIFFYQGCEPEEDETKTKYVAGWRARIGENQYGDYVTLTDGLSAAREAYDLLFDQAIATIGKIV